MVLLGSIYFSDRARNGAMENRVLLVYTSESAKFSYPKSVQFSNSRIFCLWRPPGPISLYSIEPVRRRDRSGEWIEDVQHPAHHEANSENLRIVGVHVEEIFRICLY